MYEEEIFKFAVYLFCVCVYSIIGLIGYTILLKVAKYGDMAITFLENRYSAEQRSRSLKLRLMAKRERREMSAR